MMKEVPTEVEKDILRKKEGPKGVTLHKFDRDGVFLGGDREAW